MITSLPCRDVAQNLDTMDNYIKKCRVPGGEDIYKSLINSVRRLRKNICEEGDFQKGIFKIKLFNSVFTFYLEQSAHDQLREIHTTLIYLKK